MHVSTQIAEAIKEDLMSRRGLGDVWDMFDDDIKEEILVAWADKIKCLMNL